MRYKLVKTSDKKIYGVKELNGKDINSTHEYWCYALIPDLLIDFFNQFRDHKLWLKEYYADVYLRNYLRLNDMTSFDAYQRQWHLSNNEVLKMIPDKNKILKFCTNLYH